MSESPPLLPGRFLRRVGPGRGRWPRFPPTRCLPCGLWAHARRRGLVRLNGGTRRCRCRGTPRPLMERSPVISPVIPLSALTGGPGHVPLELVSRICRLLHLIERSLQPWPEETVRADGSSQELLMQPLRQIGAIKPDTSVDHGLPSGNAGRRRSDGGTQGEH
ncbi:unnamed protein product, partial [Pleuronectes platessa]